MTQKYPKSEKEHQEKFAELPAYFSFDGSQANKNRAFAELNKATEEFCAIPQTSSAMFWESHWSDFSNLSTNTSSRPGLTKSDYYRFRPGEAPPNVRSFKDIIRRCNEAYHKVGLIRNVIDLMGDFACQGIRVVHPNKRIEKFYTNWFARVSGEERSERFCNNLFRTGNIVIKKQFAKVNAKIEENLYRSSASSNVDTEIPVLKTQSREIPFRYVFLEPSTIDVVGGFLSTFVGSARYAITLPSNIRRAISSPKTDEEKELVKKLPKDIVLAAKTSKPYLLDENKIRVFHYKKDDWQPWAFPLIYAILDDIAVLEKLRLADMAALDGAISNIRIFKLGSLEHKIVPSKAAAAKLASILQSNVGGGTIDLVWGPDIELQESKTTVHQFLGKEKYVPHLEAIYAGLGIPPTLIGSGGTGTTNNYISLKTLIQRLQYARKVLVSFWNQELIEVQKALNFRFPPTIEFDIDILDDEQTVRSLLIQLADRNLISDELLQKRFGHNSEIENIRINREQKDRESGKKVQKAGPYHDPQFGIALKKLALQTGVMTPGQVGLKTDADIFDMIIYNKTKGEKTSLEMRQPISTPITNKPKGVVGQGRPKTSKDTEPRKTKTFKPKLKAHLEIWAKNTQSTISDTLNSVFLKQIGKANMRQLTTLESKQLEKIKFGVFFNTEAFIKLDDASIAILLNKNINTNLFNTYQTWASLISKELDRPLTLDEYKQIQITLYTKNYEEIIEENYG